MRYGWCNYLITNPRDINGFVKELKSVEFNVLTGVNTLFNGLLNHPDFKNLDFSNFDFVLGGGIGMAGAADILIASDCTRFGVPEIDRGG